MPLEGFKSVTVPEEAYNQAKQLTRLGLEESIGKAFSKAIQEYTSKREQLIKELTAIRQKWSNKGI